MAERFIYAPFMEELSGPSLVRQTEEQFNARTGASLAARDMARTALDTAETARDMADQALDNARTALDTAGRAQTTADTAMSLAQSAQTQADRAHTLADTAFSLAVTAQEEAGAAQRAAQSAQDTGDEAARDIAAARELAQEALTRITTARDRTGEAMDLLRRARGLFRSVDDPVDLDMLFREPERLYLLHEHSAGLPLPAPLWCEISTDDGGMSVSQTVWGASKARRRTGTVTRDIRAGSETLELTLVPNTGEAVTGQLTFSFSPAGPSTLASLGQFRESALFPHKVRGSLVLGVGPDFQGVLRLNGTDVAVLAGDTAGPACFELETALGRLVFTGLDRQSSQLGLDLEYAWNDAGAPRVDWDPWLVHSFAQLTPPGVYRTVDQPMDADQWDSLPCRLFVTHPDSAHLPVSPPLFFSSTMDDARATVSQLAWSAQGAPVFRRMRPEGEAFGPWHLAGPENHQPDGTKVRLDEENRLSLAPWNLLDQRGAVDELVIDAQCAPVLGVRPKERLEVRLDAPARDREKQTTLVLASEADTHVSWSADGAQPVWSGPALAFLEDNHVAVVEARQTGGLALLTLLHRAEMDLAPGTVRLFVDTSLGSTLTFTGLNQSTCTQDITVRWDEGGLWTYEDLPLSGSAVLTLSGPGVVAVTLKAARAGFKLRDNPGLVRVQGSLPQTFTDTPDLTYMLYNCRNLTHLPEELFSLIPQTPSFLCAFEGCAALREVPPGLFNHTPRVTSMQGCFKDCTGLATIPEELFAAASLVTNYAYCFYNCTSLAELPKALFSACGKTTNFSYCFYQCAGLTEIPAALFDAAVSATNFSYCFRGCTGLQAVPEGLFAACEKVTNYSYCLHTCRALTRVPADLFEASQRVTNFGYCFYNCTTLSSSVPELWTRTNVTTYANCFAGCLNVSNFAAIPDAWK